MRVYVITRLIGTIGATVCAAPDADYPLQPVRAQGELVPPAFEVRHDGELTPGAGQLALAILADYFGDAEQGGTIAVLRMFDCRATRYARAFAFDHFTTANPLPHVISGEHIDRWLQAHTPVAA